MELKLSKDAMDVIQGYIKEQSEINLRVIDMIDKRLGQLEDLAIKVYEKETEFQQENKRAYRDVELSERKQKVERGKYNLKEDEIRVKIAEAESKVRLAELEKKLKNITEKDGE